MFLFILYHEFPHVMPSHPQLITFQVNKSTQQAVIKVEWNQVKVPMGNGNFPCRIINKDVFVVIFLEWILHLEHFLCSILYAPDFMWHIFHFWCFIIFSLHQPILPYITLVWWVCRWVVMVVTVAYIHGEIRDERKNKKK